MKRYRIKWVEYHSIDVWSKNVDTAIDEVIPEATGTLQYVRFEDFEEMQDDGDDGEDDMGKAHAEAEK